MLEDLPGLVISQKEWLDLGALGAALFIVLIAFFCIIYITVRHTKSVNDTNDRWSKVVDTIATRHDESMKEISKNQQALQRETNVIMRECSDAIEGLKTQVSIYFTGTAPKKSNNEKARQ